MCLYKNSSYEKYYRGLVEGVDLVLRIVCQISGQDNAKFQNPKLILAFQVKKFCSEQNLTVKMFVLKVLL